MYTYTLLQGQPPKKSKKSEKNRGKHNPPSRKTSIFLYGYMCVYPYITQRLHISNKFLYLCLKR